MLTNPPDLIRSLPIQDTKLDDLGNSISPDFKKFLLDQIPSCKETVHWLHAQAIDQIIHAGVKYRENLGATP